MLPAPPLPRSSLCLEPAFLASSLLGCAVTSVCFEEWSGRRAAMSSTRVFSIDGSRPPRSRTRGKSGAIHMVLVSLLAVVLHDLE